MGSSQLRDNPALTVSASGRSFCPWHLIADKIIYQSRWLQIHPHSPAIFPSRTAVEATCPKIFTQPIKPCLLFSRVLHFWVCAYDLDKSDRQYEGFAGARMGIVFFLILCKAPLHWCVFLSLKTRSWWISSEQIMTSWSRQMSAIFSSSTWKRLYGRVMWFLPNRNTFVLGVMAASN